ncbi:MAG: hypothetical protein HY879_27625 [Deltaproteobacteria bacterium]|nr:hypothetical protein [Deltaproteobacteria bacterium]
MLFILAGLNLFNYIDRYVLSAVRTPLAADFGLGYGDSGRLFTVFMLGYFITSPIFGLFGDMGSPEIVGRIADSLGHNLQKGLLILPVALVISGLLWLMLALKMRAVPISLNPGEN